MAVFTTLYFLCGIIYVMIGVFTFLNDPKNKSNRLFFIMCMNLAFWAFMYSLINHSIDVRTANSLYKYSTFFWSLGNCLLLHFIITLTGKEGVFDKPSKYVIFYSPALVSIYLYFFWPLSLQDFAKTNLGWVVLQAKDRGFIWTNFYNVYFFTYMVAVIFFLFTWWKNSKIIRERKQAIIILMTVMIATIAGGITDIVLPVLDIKIIPSIGIILIIIPTIGIWYSIKKYKLMDLNPENFPLEVLKIMKEGLIIVDHAGLIKDVNNGALKLLGYEKNQLKDQSIRTLFSETTELLKLTNCSSFETEMVKRNNNVLPILLSSSILKDGCGDSLGIVGIFQDISEIKLVQKKLIDSYDELEIKVNERTTELSKANEELEHEICVRIDMEEKIKNLAYYDYLTGLPNRRLFNDRLNQCILDAVRNEKTLGVLFLDLDSFKRINDTMGHDKGDELLKMVAKRLTSIIREGDTVCRVGGDEFLILIRNLKNENYIEEVSKKILSIFKESFTINSDLLYITTSVGGAIYPVDGNDVETLVKNADIAMYRAKEKGKNKFQLCTAIIKDSLIEEMRLTNSLYRALERNELELYYQPQVNLISGEIIGLEALIRWNNAELGLVNPGKFIYIAEKTGLILPIGEWVTRSACSQNKKWQDEGIINVPVAVNLSVNQFQSTKVIDNIIKILKETGLKPTDLELEITENIIMKETEYIIKSLQQLKQLGVKIAIDDFGTEYSSLNYIKQLPVDKIKIAMSFIQGININEKDEAIINVIIVLAKNLGLKVIAEGVETKEQLDYLREQMCDEIQGFYYYKPMSVNQIERLMKKK
ncbi:EAL domain-containing protein [Clostridium algoriphilum]|uniref:EAL domain-containing protein n=1 Tax=Clostridium algoriphilum TaxID=198347 RepID=UPI001CF278B3|nr:EAL domain-containing protein [Clostridium algoriphilum]MCB2296075.1 EAL domain-containing protein [Clostridium algoriphilum]